MPRDNTPANWRQIARRDLAAIVIHWTRTRPARDGFWDDDPQPVRPAHAILDDILGESRLLGGDGFIKGSYHCVCFTEAPLAEMVSMFATAAISGGPGALRYGPFGIGVGKEWLFAQGGRPVIYQSEGEYDLLPEDFRWRHCRYEPPNIDFTWEREWRIHTDQLNLVPAQTWVFVPTLQIAQEFAERRPGWRFIPLELFGLPGA